MKFDQMSVGGDVSQEGQTVLENMLSSEQKAVAEKMMADAEKREQARKYDEMAKVVNKVSATVGGVSSDDLKIEHNPVSGASRITISAKYTSSVIAAAAASGLPDTSGKVAGMTIVLQADGTAIWDYLRLTDPEVV